LKGKKIPVRPSNTILYLLYSNHLLLLLLILTLVAKCFSSRYKEIQQQTIEESMGGRNTEEPSPPQFCRYISLVVCMCVRQQRFATDWDNDLSRGSILCFLLSLLVFTNCDKRNKNLL
jgi:hypothetical protein